MGFGLCVLTSLFIGFQAGFIADVLTGSGGGISRNVPLGIAGSATGAFFAGLLGIEVRGWGVLVASVIGALMLILAFRAIRRVLNGLVVQEPYGSRAALPGPGRKIR